MPRTQQDSEMVQVCSLCKQELLVHWSEHPCFDGWKPDDLGSVRMIPRESYDKYWGDNAAHSD